MAIIKSHTDIEQSRKLAEILPLESADMGWYYSHNPNAARNQMWIGTKAENADIPCWSLAALLELLELPTLEKDGIGKGKAGWMVTHYDVNGMRYDTTYYNNPIDACVDMIIKLNELNLL